MPAYKPGELIRDARRTANLTQEDVAAWLDVDRSLISQIENGRSKKPMDTEKANKLVTRLGINPIILLQAMGYELAFGGIAGEADVALVAAFQDASAETQRIVRLTLGLEPVHPQAGRLESLRRLAAMDRQDHQGSQE